MNQRELAQTGIDKITQSEALQIQGVEVVALFEALKIPINSKDPKIDPATGDWINTRVVQFLNALKARLESDLVAIDAELATL